MATPLLPHAGNVVRKYDKTALVALGALAVGLILGRHSAPAHDRAEMLSLQRAALAGGYPGRGGGYGLAAERPSHAALQEQAEAEAEADLDAERFPGETDDYLFQRIPTTRAPYNPYLDGPYFPPSVKNYPFSDFYIPVSKEAKEGEVFSLPPLPYGESRPRQTAGKAVFCPPWRSLCKLLTLPADRAAYEALEPYIDRYTMYLHHDKANRVHRHATHLHASPCCALFDPASLRVPEPESCQHRATLQRGDVRSDLTLTLAARYDTPAL
jgi:hypothetical protein